MTWQVDAICAGRPQPFRGEEKSAFVKQPVSGPVRIGIDGLECDTQVDRKHHGGPHMALHLYPRAHHAFWREQLGEHPLLEEPGAFGTNLSVDGIDENDVFLGDRFSFGTALIEVSQPRMPCWKIEHRFGHKGMVKTILQTAKSGWYFRVIEQGEAEAGQSLTRVETQRTPWTIAEILSEIANPKAPTRSDRVAAMAGCEILGPSWREGASQVL